MSEMDDYVEGRKYYRLRLNWRVVYWAATITGDEMHDYIPHVYKLGFTADHAIKRVTRRADKKFTPKREVRLER